MKLIQLCMRLFNQSNTGDKPVLIKPSRLKKKNKSKVNLQVPGYNKNTKKQKHL